MTTKIQIPNEFKRLFDSDWREAAIYGGRYSLKSHTVARLLLIKARLAKTRVACFREFQNSINDSSYQLLCDLIHKFELNDFKITDNSIINSITGSDFIFKGLHRNEQSIKSIEGIDIAWCEEAQTLSKNSLEILTPTIRKPGSQIIYTYNRLFEDDPIHHRLVIEGRPNSLIIYVNYDVAIKYGFLPEAVLLEIEDDKLKRPGLYKHKWLGEPMTLEARIYKDWVLIDEIPHEAKLLRYGLDFGYSNDPTALIAVYFYNGGYIFDEVLYRHGMLNDQIADVLLNQPRQALTKSDSAEPKSIAEIARKGVMIVPAKKGKDSIIHGIQFIQQQRISITKRSVNLIKEYRSYIWEMSPDGNFINTPVGFMNHLLDAIRYALDDSIENELMLKKPVFGQGQFILDQLKPKDDFSNYYS